MTPEDIETRQRHNLELIESLKRHIQRNLDDNSKAYDRINDLETEICMFNYTDHDDARHGVEDYLWNIASESCGDGCCGMPEYKQKYILNSDDSKVFEGTLKVEYDRHDKRFYYIEETDYSYKEV